MLVTSVHHRSFCFSDVIEMGQTLPCIVVGTVIGDIKQTSGCPNKLGKYCRRIKNLFVTRTVVLTIGRNHRMK